MDCLNEKPEAAGAGSAILLLFILSEMKIKIA